MIHYHTIRNTTHRIFTQVLEHVLYSLYSYITQQSTSLFFRLPSVQTVQTVHQTQTLYTQVDFIYIRHSV